MFHRWLNQRNSNAIYVFISISQSIYSVLEMGKMKNVKWDVKYSNVKKSFSLNVQLDLKWINNIWKVQSLSREKMFVGIKEGCILYFKNFISIWAQLSLTFNDVESNKLKQDRWFYYLGINISMKKIFR